MLAYIGIRAPAVRFFRKLFSSCDWFSVASISSKVERFVAGPALRFSARQTERRLRKGKLRSLWGATPILTLPLKARADQLLGFESSSLVFTTYFITSNFDINLRILNGVVRRFAPKFVPVFESLLLAWFMCRYDVFHYFYDRGLTQPTNVFGINLRELELLKAAGKRVYAYAYGADVRRREETLSLGRWNFCVECPAPGMFCICKSEGLDIIKGICERITMPVALGDMLTYVPGARNLHYWPIDVESMRPGRSPARSGPLTIAHAPNHSHFKGSAYLGDVIEKLKGLGHDIRYVKIQGVANDQVIRLFGEADIVADQFIGGAYGYSALEAMACGKPVMTYVRSSDFVEALDECPLINVTPDTLEKTLNWILENRDRLPAIGSQGRTYVEKWHSISAVAARLGRMYEDSAGFPPVVLKKILAQRQEYEESISSVKQATDWDHPFRILRSDGSNKLAIPPIS